MTKASKPTYYNADDVKTPFKRASKKPKIAKLNKNITPGTVLILLAGRFKGRRVVFLKQLESGLLLVTGPYKINGVPLKRVNQAYVIPTSTKVDITGADLSKTNDKSFAKSKAKKTKNAVNQIFEKPNEISEEDKKKIDAKKKSQVAFDTTIVNNIKKTELMAAYLASRLTIRKNTKPHEMKF